MIDKVDIMSTALGSGVAFVNFEDSGAVFGDSAYIQTFPVEEEKLDLVSWGFNNHLPYRIIDKISQDEVMSTNKLFNSLTCYGSGLRFVDRATGNDSEDDEIEDFYFRNNISKMFLEQCVDMKYFYFCVSVIYLNAQGDKITDIRSREAVYTRFEKADENGKIRHIAVGDFEGDTYLQKGKLEVIPLLDETDPLSDLEIRMGYRYGRDGKKLARTNDKKFAVVTKFPTVGNRYYPVPHYMSVFRGSWFDIKQLIGLGKKNSIKNHAPLRYLVQINVRYWEQIFKEENITTEQARKERIRKEKERINEYLSGAENTGKSMYSTYYVDPNGKEIEMVKIDVIKNKAEGGDWSEDIIEASNMLCYADNIHPNLIGAAPGKAQMNNSGSDKRELFTLKQSIDTPTHDIMKLPYELVLRYNKWNKKVRVSVPMITLSVLSENVDAKLSETSVTDNTK